MLGLPSSQLPSLACRHKMFVHLKIEHGDTRLLIEKLYKLGQIAVLSDVKEMKS